MFWLKKTFTSKYNFVYITGEIGKNSYSCRGFGNNKLAPRDSEDDNYLFFKCFSKLSLFSA
jgi:hypothetical protein